GSSCLTSSRFVIWILRLLWRLSSFAEWTFRSSTFHIVEAVQHRATGDEFIQARRHINPSSSIRQRCHGRGRQHLRLPLCLLSYAQAPGQGTCCRIETAYFPRTA